MLLKLLKKNLFILQKPINNLIPKTPKTVVGNLVQATQERVKAVEEVNSPAQQVLGMVDKVRNQLSENIKQGIAISSIH